MARSIKKDKKVKALHAGKRKSKKGAKNQFGKSKGGNTYYENRTNRSDKNRTKKFDGGGSLQSMTTKQLAEKAGVSMEDMERDNLHREDLIAMITQGNYKKGGGVGKVTNDVIKSEAEWLINENWKFVLENEESHTPKRVRDLAVSDVDDYDTFRSVWKDEYNATEKDFQNLKSYIKNMTDEKILSLKKEKYSNGGGVGSEKSHEDLINEKLDSGGEISSAEFKKIIGREPCYPVCHVGGSKYRKQFLRGCYRKI